MMMNPYPQFVVKSGSTLLNPKHQVWKEGHVAGWDLARELVELVSMHTTHADFRELLLAMFGVEDQIKNNST